MQSDIILFGAPWERWRPRRLFGPREAGEDASVPRGDVRDLKFFLKSNIHLREVIEAVQQHIYLHAPFLVWNSHNQLNNRLE
jgi:hypothetical protein